MSQPRISLEQWQVLVAVVETGSHARAAERLNKTQSTITYAVQKIESLLGIKAFTAAVMGGIGNIPGAMLGGMLLGIIEAIGPAAMGIDFQLKDVIAFSILVLVLIVRPSGILGEKLSEEKL